MFWHVPLRSCWFLSYTRFDNATAAPPPVTSLQGPSLAPTAKDQIAEAALTAQLAPARPGAVLLQGTASPALPPGAFVQRRVPTVGVAPGMATGGLYWAGEPGWCAAV